MLGANDDGVITGIDDDSLQTQLDTLAKDMNNPQLFRPTCYLEFEALKVEGKNVIYGYVPESSQAHMYKGEYYDRNQDGDLQCELYELQYQKRRCIGKEEPEERTFLDVDYRRSVQ